MGLVYKKWQRGGFFFWWCPCNWSSIWCIFWPHPWILKSLFGCGTWPAQIGLQEWRWGRRDGGREGGSKGEMMKEGALSVLVSLIYSTVHPEKLCWAPKIEGAFSRHPGQREGGQTGGGSRAESGRTVWRRITSKWTRHLRPLLSRQASV